MTDPAAVLPPLSLYVHFPWCLKKCPYCDFNSHAADHWPEEKYLEALSRDLQDELQYVHGRKLNSVFFGGGTPSLMSARVIDRMLSLAADNIGFVDDIEITLEANPGATDRQRFRDYRTAGVNRISIGAQSFNNQYLKRLGRIHEADEICYAVEAVQAANIDNFNIDLMFALPGQTVSEAQADLVAAISLSPSHLSWYQLTLEPNTVFYREQVVLPEEDAQFEIMQAGQELLAAKGYLQYETSAFAKDGRQCRHNRNYWEFGDYIGIGAGAHGKISSLYGGKIQVERWQKTRVPEHYMQSISPRCQQHVVHEDELPGEFMMNALRLTGGVPAHFFTERTGLSFDKIGKTRTKLVEQGLLQQNPDRLSPTRQGALHLNEVISRFL